MIVSIIIINSWITITITIRDGADPGRDLGAGGCRGGGRRRRGRQGIYIYIYI